MFCPKCGLNLQGKDDPNFCPECGAAVKQRSKAPIVSANVGGSAQISSNAPEQTHVSKTGSSGGATGQSVVLQKQQIFAVLVALLSLAGFFPWISLNLGVTSIDYTFISLVQISTNLNNYLNTSGFTVFAMCLILFWLAIVALSVTNCIRTFMGRKSQTRLASILLASFCALLIFALLLANVAVVNGLSNVSYGTYSFFERNISIIHSTYWPWLVGILSIIVTVLNEVIG